MNKIIAIILSASLWGCATYKVEFSEGLETDADIFNSAKISKSNELPEGFQCFEPMLYVLTVGIIPSHCADTYNISNSGNEAGTIKVTSMQGWVALLLAPLPVWQYGYPPTTGLELKQKIEASR